MQKKFLYEVKREMQKLSMQNIIADFFIIACRILAFYNSLLVVFKDKPYNPSLYILWILLEVIYKIFNEKNQKLEVTLQCRLEFEKKHLHIISSYKDSPVIMIETISYSKDFDFYYKEQDGIIFLYGAGAYSILDDFRKKIIKSKNQNSFCIPTKNISEGEIKEIIGVLAEIKEKGYICEN